MCDHDHPLTETCPKCAEVVRLVLAGVPAAEAIRRMCVPQVVQVSMFDEELV